MSEEKAPLTVLLRRRVLPVTHSEGKRLLGRWEVFMDKATRERGDHEGY